MSQLRGGPCRVYSSDLKAAVRDTESYRYPDLSVVCGPLKECRVITFERDVGPRYDDNMVLGIEATLNLDDIFYF